MAVTIENIVLPERADVQRLPKKNEITPTFLLLEQRKSHNAILDILEIVVSEVKELKKQGSGNSKLLTKIEERVIPEVKQTLTDNINSIAKNNTDLQGHGFRLNVICKGKEEVDGETRETPQQTEQQFKDVLSEKLGIENADQIMFRAVHRLPKPKQGNGSNQPKPIIAAFLRQTDRDNVLSKAHLLRGTGISLQSHLPPKLNTIRNDMLKERRRLLNADNTRKLRVVDKNFSPVLQENRDNEWKTLQFPATENRAEASNGPRRSQRRNTLDLDDEN